MAYEVDWLKKNLKKSISARNRKAFIEFENKHITVKRQAELLEINRSSVYRKSPIRIISDEELFIMRGLKRALSCQKPEIINSDQGGHFTNPDYIKLLEDNGVKISMDGKGQCLDNVRTKRFFRTLKYDRIYISEYENPRELRIMLTEYMKTYNTYQPHSSLGGTCPVDYYLKGKLNKAA